MPDVTPGPDWVRLGHPGIVAYGAVCLVAACLALLWSAGFWGALFGTLMLMMTPGFWLAGLSAPIAFGLGHWIGDLVTKRQEGHIVARTLSRNAQSVHGTAVVLGTCGIYPWLWTVKEHGPLLSASMLGLVLFALALSASAHTARRRWRPLVAASFAAATYAAIGVLVVVVGGAMWRGAAALPFVAYFSGTAIGLIREPKWHDAQRSAVRSRSSSRSF